MNPILRLLLPAALVLPLLDGSAFGQVVDHAIGASGAARPDAGWGGTEHSSATDSAVFTGRVLLPNGEPAARAVVVTSTGGQTVTAADGTFALEVDVPLEAESAQITAVAAGRPGAGSLVASTPAALPAAPSHTTSVGTLVLASTDSCQPTWLPTFPGMLALNGHVNALAVFDDGSGEALYVGGDFTQAGDVTASRIARWDGTTWSALGGGLDSVVNALAVFDDGSGEALYAGGPFATAGGVAANHIARWNGASWSALGSGVNGNVFALEVFDGGGGDVLYAGGSFTSAGGVSAGQIAKWNGTSWSALGSGTTGGFGVLALAVFDDGAGEALYVGGDFNNAGGIPASNVAKWNGTGWSALGSGTSSEIRALTVFDDGNGKALYAGGFFSHAGGTFVSQIARWDGTTWSGLGGGTNLAVIALTAFDDGSGEALYAAGFFTAAGGVPANRIAKWDGTNWSALGSGISGTGLLFVNALHGFGDGSGGALYVGGEFTLAGDVAVNRIASWGGTSWSALGSGMDSYVIALTTFDDGGGQALYAGGAFTKAGGVPANRIAKWNGAGWSALGSGMNGLVNALAVFDDGSGEALYAAGAFTTAGGVPANRIAKWNGASWSALGGGLSSVAGALAVFDDGSGEALYAGGEFTFAGGVEVHSIARWDGASWSALGSGMLGGFLESISSLAVFDDGGGPALYAGGRFDIAGDVAAKNIAKWDGASWSALGSGLNDYVYGLAEFDDGSGPALYAGGIFTSPAGDAIARWNGTTWSPVEGLTNASVNALSVFDDGTGPALFVGGAFLSAGGVAANRIAKWNGESWYALGSGVDDWPSGVVQAWVFDLTVFDAGGGATLCAGGKFTVSPGGDSFVASWGCPVPPITSLPGCAGNPATLAALAPSAPLGAPLPLLITGSAATSGVGLLYFGAPGFDASGCGLVLPGLGELLLGLVPTPTEIASGVLAAGSCALAPSVPSLPALIGYTAHLQAAAVHLVAPVFVEPTNALAVTLGP